MGIDCLSAGILFADVACAPVDRLPNPGELMPTGLIQLGLGGCAANVAVDLAKVGVKVGVAGCVGDDSFGNVVVRQLEAGGTDTRGVRRIAGIGTACTMIVNVKGYDRRFISTPGANHRFTVEHIPADWVRQAKVFYVGGYLMMPELQTEALVDLFRTARRASVTTVLDVSPGRENHCADPLANPSPNRRLLAQRRRVGGDHGPDRPAPAGRVFPCGWG